MSSPKQRIATEMRDLTTCHLPLWLALCPPHVAHTLMGRGMKPIQRTPTVVVTKASFNAELCVGVPRISPLWYP